MQLETAVDERPKILDNFFFSFYFHQSLPLKKCW